MADLKISQFSAVTGVQDADAFVLARAGETLQGAGDDLISALTIPGTELYYGEVASDITVTATSGATADTIKTASELTLDGSTKIAIEFYCGRYDGNSAVLIATQVNEGATILSTLDWSYGGGSQWMSASAARYYLTPSAGAHTYSIRAWAYANAVLYGDPGTGHTPMYMRIVTA